MQTVSNRDNLSEMSNPVSWEKKGKYFQYVVCWKIYPESKYFDRFSKYVFWWHIIDFDHLGVQTSFSP